MKLTAEDIPGLMGIIEPRLSGLSVVCTLGGKEGEPDAGVNLPGCMAQGFGGGVGGVGDSWGGALALAFLPPLKAWEDGEVEDIGESHSFSLPLSFTANNFVASSDFFLRPTNARFNFVPVLAAAVDIERPFGLL